MIVPSIDIMGGQAVQLIGGEKKAIDAGDPMPIAERFAVAGDLAVIDLDAALGRGDNRGVIREIVRRYPCRVGGGIRSREAALRWLDAGALQVIIGTAAEPGLLSQLPRQRVIAALDARNGEVVVEGWQKKTGRIAMERMAELRDLVGGFLVTFVEREGRMGGMDLDQVKAVVAAAGKARVTVAGGVATAGEIGEIDRLGADVQVGMGLYTGRIALGDGVSAPMRSDRPDGLWATVVSDQLGRTLGLCWSNQESVRAAVERRQGVYHSRSRGLWIKGESSGDTQELLRIDLDCDRDALRFTVRQKGRGFCHNGTWSCFGDDRGLGRLARRLKERVACAPEGSYTGRLLSDPDLLRSKLLEGAGELARARPGEVVGEAADLFYFALVALARGGADLDQVEAEIERRGLTLTRRPGDAKPGGR